MRNIVRRPIRRQQERRHLRLDWIVPRGAVKFQEVEEREDRCEAGCTPERWGDSRKRQGSMMVVGVVIVVILAGHIDVDVDVDVTETGQLYRCQPSDSK